MWPVSGNKEQTDKQIQFYIFDGRKETHKANIITHTSITITVIIINASM